MQELAGVGALGKATGGALEEAKKRKKKLRGEVVSRRESVNDLCNETGSLSGALHILIVIFYYF